MALADKIQAIFPEPHEIPAELALEPIEQREWLIDGELRRWEGPMQEVLSPVCLRAPGGTAQARLGAYPLLAAEQSLAALGAAVAAYDNGRGRWPTMGVEARIGCVMDFVERMRAHRSEVIKLLMWEIGKSLPDAAKEFDRTVEYIEATVRALKELDRAGSRFVIEERIVGQIRRAPYGVVLCMGPFNYPLNETFTTLIPALIMGNTVVFKPAKLGVLLFRPLLEAFRDAFPRGVVNTVYGAGPVVVGPLMESGKIDVLAFIGSWKVANRLEKQHPKVNRLHTVYGLSAKNPAIILPDADLEAAVDETVLGALSFNGQRCTALKIVFVQRAIAPEFVARFAAAVNRLEPGVPWANGVRLTPLPEPGKPAQMAAYRDDALAHGARVVNECGGMVNATYFHPAVLYPVSPAMQLHEVEQFGPLVPIVPFDRIEEPVDYITRSDYGQQVALFGRDPEILARLIDPLVNQVCRVNLNSQCQRGPDTFPFTGRKDSAIGTLSVTDALRVFSIRTLVAAKENELNKAILTRIIRERRSSFLSTDFIF